MSKFKSLVIRWILLMLACVIPACSVREEPISTTTLSLGQATVARTPTRIPSRTPTRTHTATQTLTPTESFLAPARLATLGSGTLSSIFRSPDGKTVAFAEGGILYLYDGETFDDIGAIELEDDWVGRIYFSPDSRLVAVTGYFNAQLIDLESQTTIGKLGGAGYGLGCLRFSRGNQLVAYVVYDRSTGGPYYYITTWNVAEARSERSFPVANPDRYHTVTCPALSSDGTWVAAGYADSTEKILYIWDVRTGEIKFAIEEHGSGVTDVDVSPDGKYLASGSYDGTVRLWNPQTGKLVRVINGFQDDVEWVDFSRDGRLLHVGVYGQPEQVFDMLSGQLRPAVRVEATPDPFATYMHLKGYSEASHSMLQILFSPDGRTLTYGSSHVLLWDVQSGELLTSLEGFGRQTIRGMDFSLDGDRVAAIGEEGEILVWDIHTGEKVLALSAEVLGLPQVIAAYSESGIGPAIGGGVLGELGIAFSPDGQILAIGNGMDIELLDFQRKEKVLSLERVSKPSLVTRVCFSQDGAKLYAVLNRNRAAGVWDAHTGELLHEVNLPTVDMNAYTATDLRGKLFARNNSDEEGYWIEVWDLESENVKKLTMPGRENEPMRFSPDGEFLLVKNGEALYFWKVETGQLVHVMDIPAGQVGFAVSPDSRTLAIGNDGIVELWDIREVTYFAQSPYFSPAVPPPTPTPYASEWPTATPQPTLMTTPMDVTSVSDSAISPSNADRVVELASFGKGTIDDATWSRDSRMIVLSGSEGVFQVDSVSLTETDHLKAGAWFTNASYVPGQRLLAAGADGDTIQVWDVQENELLFEQEGWGDPALSPDGRLAVFLNEEANLQTWDIARHEPVTTLHSYFEYPHSPVFSPDSRYVAAIQGDHSVRVWEVRSGKIINGLGGPDGPISTIAFSNDGQYLVGAAAGSAWVWTIQPGFPRASIDLYEGVIDDNLTLYDNEVSAVALSPGNRILAIGTTERDILLYARQSRELLRVLEGHAAPIDLLRFSPGGGRLLSVDRDGVLRVWDVASGEPLVVNEDHLGSIQGLVFGIDGKLMAWEGNTTWVIRPKDGSVVESTSIFEGMVLAASPAGDWLAVYDPYQVSLWNAITGQKEITLEGEAEEVFIHYRYEGLFRRKFYNALFSDDGSRLVTLGSGGAWVYDTSDGRLLHYFLGSIALKAAFSPDNQRVVSCLQEMESPPKLWDIQTGDPLISLEGRGYDYSQLAYSPDGRWIAAVSYGWRDDPPELMFFGVSSGLIERRMALASDINAISVTYSPDGRLVAIGQEHGSLLLIDVDSLEIVAALDGHKGVVEHLAFSKDGTYLASGGEDGTVIIWGLP